MGYRLGALAPIKRRALRDAPSKLPVLSSYSIELFPFTWMQPETQRAHCGVSYQMPGIRGTVGPLPEPLLINVKAKVYKGMTQFPGWLSGF